MNLAIKDVAKLFNVSEKTIYRWIKQESIPVYRINDQYRFNQAELLEWASAHRIMVNTKLFSEPEEEDPLPTLANSLDAGGIFYQVEGETRNAVLAHVVRYLRLPDGVDRDFLYRILVAREDMESTGITEGIAIPHARNPILQYVSNPTVTLCFLEKPVDFKALDGKLVHTLFTLVTPTVKSHLHLLSRLAYALRNQNFQNVIKRHGLREDILQAAQDAENEIKGHALTLAGAGG